ncbi:hypothetical protein JCM9279_002486 [Rhodotorula babjevae]
MPYRPLDFAEGEGTHPHHSTPSYPAYDPPSAAHDSAGIRAVPYDSDDEAPFIGGQQTRRPPSFRSHDDHSTPAGGASSLGAGQYLGERDASMSFEQSARLTRAYESHHEIYDPDLELRLEAPAPLYTSARRRADGEARDGARAEWDEDVKDPGEFEDSFEAGRELDVDGEEHDGADSPALSFAGGFGAPPTTAHLRRKNLQNRRVKLTEGNLVIPCAIPTRLLGFLPRKDGDEFTQTRYSAVTCAPEDFDARNYTLRPSMYDRQTELFIVVTMYNEDEQLFCRTMHGVMKNISQLCKRKKSATWGPDGWKKVVVCIVADGRKAIHPRVLDCLAALGVYQPNVATNQIDSQPVQCHLYEHTTQMSIAPDMTFRGLEKGIVPCQIMFALKEKNAKKINSHRWALQAFAPQLDPRVVILIDVGTTPEKGSIYELWKAFDLNSNVGGACGEIVTMKGKFWTGLLNPLVAAQNFEYKISNILDKPLESIFGYISVLPGAFSAYRYIALKNDELGHGPLASYFKGETLAGHDADLQTSNMYLAEDRILCWELVAKRGHAWVLKYVKAAKGETDVPDTIAEFIGQRRRWLNGSFFAGVYALMHTLQLLDTQHSKRKVCFLFLQALYNLVNVVFAWIGLSSYWIFFMVLTTSLEDPTFNIPHIAVANRIMQYAYIGAVIASFLMSMGNRPKAAQLKYLIVIIIFSTTTAYMFGAAGYCVYKAVQRSGESLLMAQIVISLVSTYGVYVLASLIALDPWHLVTSMAQYMLAAPIYINLLNIYSFSNLHDFSWGTKEQNESLIDLGITRKVGQNEVDMALPADQTDIDVVYDRSLHNLKTRPMIVPPPLSNKQKEEAVRDHYQSIRTNVLLSWVLTNALLVAVILEGDYASTFSSGGGNGRTQIYLVIVLVFVAILSLIRFVGSTAYVIDGYVRLIGAFVQRKLFARRQVGQQSQLRRRPPMSEVGTEVKSDKVDVDEDDAESIVERAGASAMPSSSARRTDSAWYVRG